MRIGELAAKAGVNIQTIRFYERRGLLKRPRRLPSGYRDYPSATVKIITFIKRNQKVGFSLREIGQTLKAMSDGSPGALNPRSAIEKRILAIDEQIQALRVTRDELAACLGACVCGDGETPCPGSQSVAQALTER
jgi:DNA-binding transcriptional MerR regulator